MLLGKPGPFAEIAFILVLHLCMLRCVVCAAIKISSELTKSTAKISGYQMSDDKEVQVLVRMTADMASRLDEYRRLAEGIPSRPEAVRRIVSEFLAQRPAS